MRRLILLSVALLLVACGDGEAPPSTNIEGTIGTAQSTPQVALSATPVPPQPRKSPTPVVLPPGVEPDSESGSEGTNPGLSTVDVELGDCFPELGDEMVSILEQIPCDQPHGPETYHLADYPAGPDAPYPGREEIYIFAEELCITSFEGYVGIPYLESEFQITYLEPTEDRWKEGDREVACILYSNEGSLVGSMKGSNR